MQIASRALDFIRRHTHLKVLFLMVCDLISASLSLYLAALLIQSVAQTWPKTSHMMVWLLFSCVTVVMANYLLRLYSLVFSCIGIHEGFRIFCSFTLLLALEVLLSFSLSTVTYLHAILFSLLYLCFSLGIRFFRRMQLFVCRHFQSLRDSRKPAMIVGAGNAGTNIIREMQTNTDCTVVPVCIVDDSPAKIGLRIHDVPVVGSTYEIAKYAKKYRVKHIYVAMPSVSKPIRAEILKRCQETGLDVKTLPSLSDILGGRISLSLFQNVKITDLLGRDQITVNLDEIMGYIEGKTVLVTGGGGSIGSELCRQIATHKPKKLIILDIYENNAYDIEQELRRNPSLQQLNLLTLIASVRDRQKLEDVFAAERPDIVFHAAAHKHVPLMETSPCEAVKNNVFGTLNLAQMADKYGVERFIQISTDKAVNPTNVMGATKRICEMIIQTMGRHSKTKFVAVRFGNVLGSNGSVIPLFKKQIAEGGPVTVTDKEIVRYFMTIPEAVSLVLQAGAYAEGGQIFVLDMG